MKRISPHCSYAEATKSNTAERLGIDNTPGGAEIAAMRLVAARVFEKARNHFKTPIFISSFYRSPELNKAIGGSTTSQHCKGEAMDLDCDIYGGITNKELGEWIRKHCSFDQIIFEYPVNDGANYKWIHVSYSADGNRGQVLEAYKENGRTKYRKL